MHKILDYVDILSEGEDPIYKAQKCSRLPLIKRFYEKVTIVHEEEGFSILLDERPIKTPAQRHCFVPTEALAGLVAQEFKKQEEVIDPAGMPVLRLVNTVIDGVVDNMQIIFEDILRFVACDMIFYRAQTPKALLELQHKHWDFLLNWAEERLGAHFNIAEGIMHVEQPWEAIQAVSNYLRKVESPYILAGIHTITTLTGSALIAFAILEKKIDSNYAWLIANLDEDWTMEQWGKDEEAMKRRAHKKDEFDAAVAMVAAVHQ
ncbi:ATP12 family chaperone protein [Bartonella ancashensis]|uniref:Chaperone required for the assembly of the mitochondrial F1-ATPase n=1 Tax=Bartonella ancashensis TaxID=1318743 RepID=A0A0M4LIX1_9HYPH|nr:ATP12 family protein [Bartonella ancashensis]ALE03706.1 Chaperone required for the assembly of the mitochondrial F1-ATPase [Bartonella ancashensis]